MWGVVEAMLSQVGKLSEAVKKERERRLQKGVRVFIRASEMACLTASISPGVSICGHLVLTFLPCTTAHTTPRKSPSLSSHRTVQPSNSQS